ncbi:HEAT repeat domain-containing protein [Haliangium ochraceum]|uniref:PBS lyase HEAT domain protein repeat-containing protein n=1 Tax=Haliangium ochraceum (strain DSM 14365 / JCM 11303 / SMP-2) TaxID=502025 RepID=D0LNN9_HALO1|nr:HEAT repeat domain-containing protein [Haliangium ochraceum]ACY16944.1 PBS lyase HEAT domain protein repeat-containing protein [Haliangium ochraceum DSM 14365]
MVGNACPTCAKPIDPARAPVARVRGGRVVTFCSQACADASRPDAPSAEPPATSPEPAAAAKDAKGGRSKRRARTAILHEQERGGARDSAAGSGDSDETAEEYAGRRSRSSGRRRVIALSTAILLGGMAITVINAVSPSTPVDVNAASEQPTRRSPASGDGASSASPSASTAAEPSASEATPYQRAQQTLRELLASTSPRVQRIAAMALSRLGAEAAPQAVARLGELLEQEPSALGRMEIAYALARAGDERGRSELIAALRSERRDVRLEAARSLVQLGTDLGNTTLEHMLRLRTHRLGVAGLLARRGNEKGLEALREVLDDDDTTPELAMRAAVALGRAGDESVRGRLVEILEDGRYHVGAADALAALEDPAAVPALTRQLGLSSMCVRAALGLRRLDQSVSLDELAEALDTGSESARVSAAEAILILAGPQSIAEYD